MTGDNAEVGVTRRLDLQGTRPVKPTIPLDRASTRERLGKVRRFHRAHRLPGSTPEGPMEPRNSMRVEGTSAPQPIAEFERVSVVEVRIEIATARMRASDIPGLTVGRSKQEESMGWSRRIMLDVPLRGTLAFEAGP